MFKYILFIALVSAVEKADSTDSKGIKPGDLDSHYEIDFEQGDIELLHWCDGPSPLTLGSHAAPTACTAAAVDRILWPFTISSPTRNAMHCVRRRTAS